MSVVSIRKALETSLLAMTPAIPTKLENQTLSPAPAVDTPFQECYLKFAKPSNRTIDGHQELGFMQVNLRYPKDRGTSAIEARAELIRSTFRRASTHSADGVNVIVTDTPEISEGEYVQGRHSLTVRVRFMSNIN